MIDQELAIRVRGLDKTYGNTVALQGFNLDVWEGNLVGLLGPSGCGKTTALRAIAGFERPDHGTIDIHGRRIVDETTFVLPEKRNVGMVFQDYALFPHMSVAANVAFGLPGRHDPRVGEVIEMVGLAGLGTRMPHELSGGQQQRVALARALAPGPGVILLDEPFSNLDATLRDRVRREVRSILREAETTAVFVTHDQEEALALSDVVAVMENGTIVQAATPDELYLNPSTRFVAAFVGDADFVPGVAKRGKVVTPIGTFDTALDGNVSVMIRPESVSLAPTENGNATIHDREFFGHDQLYVLRLNDGQLLRARTGPMPILDRHQRVQVSVRSAIAYPDDGSGGHPSSSVPGPTRQVEP